MTGFNSNELWIVDLGVVDYGEALGLQRWLVAAKKSGALDANLLLLLQHPAVITLGRRGDDSNILASPQALAARDIRVHHVERGGDVTYHAPGQLVGYPIINLRHVPNRQDVGKFVWVLQEAIIRTLARYAIPAERIEKVVGVWVRRPLRDGGAVETGRGRAVDYPERKIAAIGARVEGWITFHGFALNVTTDLSGFDLIVPCGLEDRGVTSMALELGHDVPMDEIKRHISTELSSIWGFIARAVDAATLEAILTDSLTPRIPS